MAGTAADKENLGSEARRLATDYAAFYNQTRPFVELFFDGTYGSGGANEIEDADLINVGIMAAELSSMVTFLQQLDKLWDNEAVTQGDYSVTINSVKNVKFN